MQMIVNRRSVMKGSVALSLSGFVDSTRAQNSAAATPSSPISISPDLLGFVANQMGGIMSKAVQGNANKQDIRNAASHLSLLSSHLNAAGFDEQFSKSLPAAAPIDFSATPPSSSLLPALKVYEPTVTQDMFWPTAQTATVEQVQKIYNQTKSAGFSGMLSQFADQIHQGAGSSKFRNSPTVALLDKPVFNDGIFRLGDSAGLVRPVQSCSVPGGPSASSPSQLLQNFCAVAGITIAALGATLTIIIAQCESNPVAFTFCESLAAEVAAVGFTVGTTIALGLAAITILVLIMC